MEEKLDRLAKALLTKNHQLNYDLARNWVEALWEDFETTRAKAGRSYEGQDMTEMIVTQWIQHYGHKLHEFASTNEKFKHLSEFHNNQK